MCPLLPTACLCALAAAVMACASPSGESIGSKAAANASATASRGAARSRATPWLRSLLMRTRPTPDAAVPERERADFSAHVLAALRKIPVGGGYSTKRKAAENLAHKAVVWNEATGSLSISPRLAQPSFCSEACYLALLLALQEWERTASNPLSPACRKYLRVDFGQPDGRRGWGRMNANGPGLAKWVRDLEAGVNFTDPAAARPGDFLKIFWTPEIGKKEFGHMVVFLGLEKTKDGPGLRFWSSNKPLGFGEKVVPLAKINRMIFTRIERPERFAASVSLPETDAWLADMQRRSFSWKEVGNTCGLILAPLPPPAPGTPAPCERED